MNLGMKIVICTIPTRTVPSDHIPFGSLAIIQALRGAGYDPYFMDIDCLRPSQEELARFFKEYRPNVLGISGVVSTSYAYVKRLCALARSILPEVRIILGANLAASSEICLRKGEIDYCVIGDGERTAVGLCNYIRDRLPAGRDDDDDQALGAIGGLSFLNRAGEMVLTGYAASTPVAEMPDPDLSILEKYSRLDTFLVDPLTKPDFAKDPRSHEPRRKGLKRGIVLTAKGCVARCSFCHRWEKGYRTFSTERIVRQIRHLKEHYGVGFINFADENFGSDRRQLDDLIPALKELDILYMVGGVRCSSVDPDLLRRLKDSGCVSLNYGMETGSARILGVMEKKLSLEDNRNAALWTQEAGLYTIYQIVLGLPGENDETISETTEFFKKVTENLTESPLIRFRVNYLQLLPGSPVYEYARRKGLLGTTIEDEENYLLGISDIDAADETGFFNLTDSSFWTVQSWRRRITLECIANYRAKNKLPPPSFREIFLHMVYRKLRPAAYDELRRVNSYAGGLDFSRPTYFNFLYALYYDVIASYLYPVRTQVLWLWLLAREFKRLSLPRFLAYALETLRCRLRDSRSDRAEEYRSVRKMLDDLPPVRTSPSEAAMVALRSGR